MFTSSVGFSSEKKRPSEEPAALGSSACDEGEVKGAVDEHTNVDLSAMAMFQEELLHDEPTFRDISPAFEVPSLRQGSTVQGLESFNLSLHQPPVYRSVGTVPDSGRDGFQAFRGYEREGQFDVEEYSVPNEESAEEPPEAPGGYLEKTSLHCSSMKPIELMKSIEFYLKEKRIDHTADRRKYKIKCQHFHGGAGCVDFNIRVFSHSKKYAVEVQRRQGCCQAFANLFRELEAEFFKLGMCEGITCSGQGKNLLCSPLLDDLDLDDGTEDENYGKTPCPLGMNMKGCVKSLMKMVSSDFTDVQMNALQSIAKMTSCKAGGNCKEILAAEVSLFLRLLTESEDEAVKRGSATCIANLTHEQAECCKKICMGDGVDKLSELTSSKNLQIARESCRALANIGAVMGPGILTDPFKEKLQKLMLSSDTRLRENVDHLLQTAERSPLTV